LTVIWNKEKTVCPHLGHFGNLIMSNAITCIARKTSFFPLFSPSHNAGADGGNRGFNWWQFQHGNEPLPGIVRPVWVGPRIALAGLWVPGNSENLHFATPYCLPAKNLVDRHGGHVAGPAAVQMANHLR
jgi:hypothetical protein